MKIAVMSDSHDHLENIEKTVALAAEKGADILIHCGDILSLIHISEPTRL